MDSWAGYAAVSYGQRVDGFQPYCGQTPTLQPYCGQPTTLQPYCGQPSLQPTYDPVFPPLLQKSAYGRPDPDDWPRHHPFGVLPHEAAAFPFPPQNPALNPHQVPGRRSPANHDLSPSFFQSNFPPTDPLQKIPDYSPRLYPNLQPNDSPLKDYRAYRQDCDRLYDKPDLAKKPLVENDTLSQLYPSLQQPQTDLLKDYRFQAPEQDQINTTKKTLDTTDPREYSQSSPISFALMDQRLRSPQFQQSAFRYPSVATPDEFQRSKSSESFSSNSSSECSQRPSPLQQPPSSFTYNNNNQSDCYKEPSVLDTPQRYPLTYSTIFPRDNHHADSNRFDEAYNRQTWEDKRKYNYDVPRVQNFDNNQNSCRGDPMSLVRNLHNTPDKASEAEKRNRDGVVDDLLREPPPAHNHTAVNQNYSFERWNLPAPGSKILTQVALSQTRITGDRPQPLVLPATLSYFPTLQIQKPPSPLEVDKDDVDQPPLPPPRPSIKEELAFLLSDEAPKKIKFIPKNSLESCIEEYEKFLRGKKDKSPPRVFSKPYIPVTKSTAPTEKKTTAPVKQYPSDPQDDPRYYPLPKSDDQRIFEDSSDDSSEDSFTTSLVQKLKGSSGKVSSSSNAGRRCACKTSTGSSKKKKIVKEERSTQTSANNKNHNSKSCQPEQSKQPSSTCTALGNQSSPQPSAAKITNYVKDSEQAQGGNSGTSVKGPTLSPSKKASRKSRVNPSLVSPFKVDDFIVHKGDKDVIYPAIWRVKENNILQKFQHFVKDGVNLYIGLPSVVALSLHNSNIYHSVPVNVAFLNKSPASSIVQVLNYPFQPSRPEKQFTDSYLKEMAHLQDSFEVFIQTLFSQALDSNFLQEIYDEKDEYFLSRVGEVEAVMSSLQSRLASRLPWPPGPLGAVAAWPSCRLGPGPRGGRPCVCGGGPSSCLLSLHGCPYHGDTLLKKAPAPHSPNKEIAVCTSCVKLVQLLHTVSHQKLGLFVCCEERVNKARDPSKDTTSLLNYLLADQPFLNQLFREVRLTWAKIERCLKEN